MLTPYLTKDQTDWDLYLPNVCFAYRSSTHISTQESPFQLLYGREPNFPSDVSLNTLKLNADEVDLLTRLKNYRDLIPKRLEVAQANQKKYYDNKHKYIEFKVGDIVWLHEEVFEKNTSAKLSFKWKGPY